MKHQRVVLLHLGGKACETPNFKPFLAGPNELRIAALYEQRHVMETQPWGPIFEPNCLAGQNRARRKQMHGKNFEAYYQCNTVAVRAPFETRTPTIDSTAGMPSVQVAKHVTKRMQSKKLGSSVPNETYRMNRMRLKTKQHKIGLLD